MRHSGGFTMIELLVGLLVSLLAALAIMQAVTTRETDRRSIGALSDANSNASIAFYMLEREMQQAGLGFNSLSALGCAVSGSGYIDGRAMVPFQVIPAGTSGAPWNLPQGDSGSDTIIVMYGMSSNASEGQSVTTAASTGDVSIKLTGVAGLQPNDGVLIAEQAKSCTLSRVSTTTPSQNLVNLDSALGDNYSNAARMHLLGSSPRLVAYTVRHGNLVSCDLVANDCRSGEDDPAIWIPVVNDISAIVAEYGVDTDTTPDGFVNRYCQKFATRECGSNNDMTSCDRTRILALRLAVVARSSERAKENVSPETMKLWNDSDTEPITTGPMWTIPDRTYRYRSVASIISLRNIQLMGAQPGC